MGALDQVTQMKGQGLSENEIVTKLQEQGIAPKEISEALGQSQIKNAVSDDTAVQQAPAQEVPMQQDAGGYDQQGGEGNYAQQPESPIQEEYYPQNNPYEGYGEGGYGGTYDSGMNTDAFIEVAEQVFAEKMKTIQKQLDDLNEFKALAKINLDHNSERIKRVEQTMDKLQMAILDRVGTYGKSLEGIKREMTMMQDSFTKMVKPIAAHAITRKPIHPVKALPAVMASPTKRTTGTKKKTTSKKK